ncbi:hypothetical protein Fot_33791 [Forsythia ovata]|uniref:Uncharacterized protein n=1 Tax=Forsythia ovata TaxID=205694 RepID=A0ABD1TBS3_9LAMI
MESFEHCHFDIDIDVLDVGEPAMVHYNIFSSRELDVLVEFRCQTVKRRINFRPEFSGNPVFRMAEGPVYLSITYLDVAIPFSEFKQIVMAILTINGIRSTLYADNIVEQLHRFAREERSKRHELSLVVYVTQYIDDVVDTTWIFNEPQPRQASLRVRFLLETGMLLPERERHNPLQIVSTIIEPNMVATSTEAVMVGVEHGSYEHGGNHVVAEEEDGRG